MKTTSPVVPHAPQSRGMSASLRRLVSRRTLTQTAKTLAVSALFAFGAASAQAQTTYQYQGGGTTDAPTSSVFSTGFTPTISADGTTSQTTTADTLSFGGAAGGASYTATDDLTSTINANALSFSNIAGIVATLARSTATGASNSITLGTGTTAPTVTSGAGAVVNGLDLILANNTTFNIGAGGFSQNGAVSGAGSLTKTGSGGLILSGNNSYSGGTTISAGSFAIGSDTAVGTGALTIGGSSQILAAVNGNRTIANNVIFSSNRLVIDKNGNFNTGLTTGSLTINGNVAFNMSGAGPSDLFLRNNLTLNGIVSGSNNGIGILLAGDAGTLTLTNAGNTFSGGINFGIASIVLASSDGALGAAANNLSFQANGNGTLRAGASFNSTRSASAVTGVTGTFDTNGFNLGLSGILSGAGNYNKAGAGTLTLTGANTYTGTTSISAGTLQIGSGGTSGALGTGAVTDNGTLVFNRSDTPTVANVISGTGGLTQSGGGLNLTAVNTYTGATNVNAGILNLKRTTQTAIAGASAVTVSSGATLQITDHAGGGQQPYGNALTLSGFGSGSNGALDFFNSGAFSMTGAVNLAGDTGIKFDPQGQSGLDINFTNVISGVGSLTLFSRGNTTANLNTTTLSGANTYSGANTTFTSSNLNTTTPYTVTLSGGDNRLPAGTNVFFGGSPTAITGTFNSNVTLALNGINQQVASVQVASGATGTYRIVGASTTLSTLNVANATASAFSGIVGGTGTNNNNLALVKTGTGTETLTGTNTYSGGTTVSSGTLNAASDAALGAGALAFNPTTGNNATVTFTSANPGVGSLASSGAGTSAVVLGSTGATPNATILTFGSSNASTTYSGTISDGTGTNAAARGSLVKTGTGTQTLAGATADTYAGGTTVSAGTLSGNTGSYGTGAVSVAQNATVDYTQSGAGTATNNITGAGTATFGGNTTSADGTGGTITYTGQDSAGQTNVQSGTVILNNASGPALSGPVAVATGGTVQLGASSQIATSAPPASAPTTAAVTLNGGHLNANGNSDGAVTDPTNLATTNVTQSMGALSLGGSSATTSILDFGASQGTGPFVLAFADSSGTLGSGMLNILDYTGGRDALYIGTSAELSTTQLGQINFNGMGGAAQLANGEIVLAAAPEPSSYVSFGLGLLGLSGLVVRAKKRKAAAKAA